MITIRTAQLIYTRVELSYSPQNKAGFQTVYKSKSLSEQDVSDIEKRVQCFQPYLPAPIRRQFFMLNSGNAVLTHTTQIEPDPEIIDISRRKGAFITHSLILDKGEFDKVERNPFIVFDNFQFVTTAKSMVNTFGNAEGVAPTENIEVYREYSVPSCSWTGNEIRKLLLLAAQTEQLLKEGKSVFLLGQEDDIDKTLRIVFHFIPRYQRSLCTFDTCIDGCSVQAGLYWAVGATRHQGGSSYIQVNMAEQRVISPVRELTTGEDLYWGWLNMVTSKGNFESAIQRAPTIQILSNAFAEREDLNINELDEEACHEFSLLYREQILEILRVTFTSITGKNVADLLLDYIYQTFEMPILLNIAASQSIDLEYLSSLLTDYIFTKKPDLDEGDWKILQNIAQRSDNPLLLYLSVTFRKKIDEEIRDKALLSMDEEDYQRILDFLANPVEPSHFVTPRFLPLLVEDHRLEMMNDEQFLNLVKAIVEANASEHLDSLAKFVEELENKPLLQLEKFMKKHSDVIPHLFWAKMMERREELGKPSRILGIFRR